MRESFKEYGNKVLGKAIIETITPVMHRAYEERGCVGIAEKAFDILHAKPEYTRHSDPDFHRNRQKLNSEPGLIISNHPGPGDCPAVLNALERRDLKFLVAEEAIKQERLSSIVPEDMLLGAAKDVGKLRMLVKKILEHIHSGGALFYFPTGLAKKQNDAKFAGLFSALLRGIPADGMVYAFNIDSADVQKVVSKGRFAFRSSADFLLPEPMKPILKVGERSIIRVDEKYTKASDWLERYKQSGRSKSEMNDVMTEHYDSLFYK